MMVFTQEQNIPSYFQDAYRKILQLETLINQGAVYGISLYGAAVYSESSIAYVRKRYPFRLPSQQGGLE